jgi:ribonucleotide reductase alpha subunit
MLDKDFVPVNASKTYCLNWLAGLLDADGCMTHDEIGSGFQITSVDGPFLNRVRLMLTRLGVRAKVVAGREAGERKLPTGSYFCQKQYRLLVGNWDAARLIDLGLKLERLQHDGMFPQRDARQFVTVVSVTPTTVEETFCFTEPKAHRGTFNGIVTGQCAEQPLPPYGACLLGSFNLVKYVNKGLFGHEFDFEALRADVPWVVRAMDNVVDHAYYPLPQQRQEALSKRRMGLGVTGVANALEACGAPYGSAKFRVMFDEILKIIANESYRTSAFLAEEKGTFPLYDREKYLQSKFVRKLDEDVQDQIRRFGIRNSHLTSIAPTGTISLTADNISSGIEPVFSYGYDRTIQTFDGPRIERVDDYGVRVFGTRGRTADQLSVQDHVSVLIDSQRWVDSAISKTCNVGGDVTFDEFKSVYVTAYKGGAKGCTTFRANGKRFGVLNAAPEVANDEGQACYFDPETGAKSCA